MSQQSNWELTSNRFVAFFDILGFKDLVMRSTHSQVLEKLAVLKETIINLGKIHSADFLKKQELEDDQTRSVTFSDSIIFFSKGDTKKDAFKILLDCYGILLRSLENGIAIKGAVSFGQVTVDFDNSLFFGQAIIDAYLLHEDLQMLTVVMDNHSEVKFNSYYDNTEIIRLLSNYKANLKSGRITHSLLRPSTEKDVKSRIATVNKLYDHTSGRPRIYIDNTLEFLRSLVKSSNGG